VAIVDDDASVREALPALLGELGFAARTFDSAEAFLDADDLGEAGCLLLDIALPGMTGLELHRELMRRGHRMPVIFITGQRDETLRARALAQGAVEVLRKPFHDTALQAALARALASR
jgi:FixJ family two-component response regulator